MINGFNFLTNDSGINPLHVLSLLPTHPWTECHKISSFLAGFPNQNCHIKFRTLHAYAGIIKAKYCNSKLSEYDIVMSHYMKKGKFS